jgi:hypothetical protein
MRAGRRLKTDPTQAPTRSPSQGAASWSRRSVLRPTHRRIAISLLAGTLNSAAPFSMAVASSGASTFPSQTAFAAIL